jgi:hypothetical protein
VGIFSALTPLAAVAAGTVTLAWDASLGTNVIANYKVYYGVASRTYTNSAAAGTNLTVSVSNLVSGATYYFAATATDTSGLESDYSTEVSTVIAAPNQPPTLNVLANVTMNEDASTQVVNLSGITDGSTNETQTLTVTASSSNPGLIPNPPVSYTSPSATGSISLTPAADMYGSAVITVTVNDNAASNNIFSRTFNVTVNPVNDIPTLTKPSDVVINEGAGQQTVNLSGIGSGAANESQTLIVTASSSNTGLIPNPTVSYTSPNSTGSLTFTPSPYANGSATITVTVNDGGTSNNVMSRTFAVTVNGINNAPTLTKPADLTISENAGQQTVNLTGISSGAANENDTLVVTASSSNTGLIPNPTVTYTSPSATGSVAFTPVPYANGSATITVTVNDGASTSNTVSRTFTVTVNAVNQAPTLDTLANLTVNENAGQQIVNLTGIGTGAANESQTLVVTASSSNTGLIPNPAVTYTSPNAAGSLRFTPVTNAFGSATITVTVNDGGASNNVVSQTFTVTVNQVNGPPSISSIADRIVAVDTATPAIPFTVSDAETPSSSLTVSGNSDNTTLVPNARIVFGGSGGNRTVTVTPAAGQTGVATITVTVGDGTDSASTSFRLSVRQRPGAPGGLRIVSVGP